MFATFPNPLSASKEIFLATRRAKFFKKENENFSAFDPETQRFTVIVPRAKFRSPKGLNKLRNLHCRLVEHAAAGTSEKVKLKNYSLVNSAHKCKLLQHISTRFVPARTIIPRVI